MKYYQFLGTGLYEKMNGAGSVYSKKIYSGKPTSADEIEFREQCNSEEYCGHMLSLQKDTIITRPIEVEIVNGKNNKKLIINFIIGSCIIITLLFGKTCIITQDEFVKKWNKTHTEKIY